MNPEIGMPLNEMLGGAINIVSANGPGFCGNVMKACGFDVSHGPAPQPPQPSSGVAGLVRSSFKPQV